MLILASSSIGRKRVLKNLGLRFEIIPAYIDEEKITSTNHIALVKKIAKVKALAILARINTNTTNTTNDKLIIAADSMVVFRGQTYGKPKTKEEAKRFLRIFSGKTHEFITGLCVINTKTKRIYQASAKTKVKFEKLTQKEIDDYVAAAPVTLFAGAYSLEEEGAEILKPKITILGSKSNVLGLPVEKLTPILRKEGINIQKSLPV